MKSETSAESVLCRFVRLHFDEPVVVLHADGGVIELNQAAWDHRMDLVRLFGASSGDVEIVRFLEQTRTQGRATLALSRGAGPSIVHYRIEGTAVAERIVVVVRDVTRERALEDEVRHLRRVETLGLLTARLIHDFNNLLTPVRVLGGHLAGRLAGTELGRLAAHVDSGAERASALVRDMLAFARPARDVGTVELGRVVDELRPLLERLVGDDIELVISLAHELGPVELDRTALEHALLNLVANARDAMPNGGRIAIVTSEANASEPQARTVSLSVTDGGVGMSEDVAERAFDELFTTKASGNGLGLAAVRRFVLESGGAISIDTAEGRGTSVVLRFPSVAPEPIEPRVPPSAAPRGGSETILIVDRAEQVRTATRIVLEANGYRVVEATSAESATRAALANEIDLILVDAAATQSPSSAALPRGIPSIVMSGEHVAEPDDFSALTKAFSERELLGKVREAIDRRS